MGPVVYSVASTSEDEHPLTEAVQPKKRRKTGHKKAKQAEDADLADLLHDFEAEHETDIPGLAAPSSPQDLEPGLVPVGVLVLDEGADRPEIQRRTARYFDDDFLDKAIQTCHRCGEPGHIARECTAEVKLTCSLCAGHGHIARDCPNTLCFKCQKPGHIARDCPNAAQAARARNQAVCLRCGSSDCPAAGAPDFRRAEGACQRGYSKADLSRVRCCVCYQRGHLCCRPLEPSAAPETCFNCGQSGHLGEECVQNATTSVRNERLFGDRRPTHASTSAGHSYGQHGGAAGRQQYSHHAGASGSHAYGQYAGTSYSQHDDRYSRPSYGNQQPDYGSPQRPGLFAHGQPLTQSHASSGWLPHGTNLGAPQHSYQPAGVPWQRSGYGQQAGGYPYVR